MDKVRRAELPFAVLRTVNQEANSRFVVMMRASLGRIRKIIEAVQPGPDEGTFIAMTKALLPREELLVKRWWARRETIGMGQDPTGALETDGGLAEALKPWLNDWRLPERITKVEETGPRKEGVVQVGQVVFASRPKLIEVIEVLRGKELVPVVVLAGGTPVVTKGTAVVWAAKLLGIPALAAIITKGTVEGEVEGVSLWEDWDFLRARAAWLMGTGRTPYTMPTSLEPVAQLARTTAKDEFKEMLRGEHPAERAYGSVMEEEARLMTTAWARTFEYLRKRGVEGDDARARVEKDEEYRKGAAVSDARVADAFLAAAEGRGRREALHLAEQQCVKLMEEDGLPPPAKFREPGFFWAQAQLAPSGVFLNEGEVAPTAAVPMGAKVQAKDLLGEWHDGVVVYQCRAGMKVKRADGKTVNVRRPSQYRAT